MDARLSLFGIPVAAKILKHLISADKMIADSTPPAATQELVKIRATQINGCGSCTAMHTNDATHARETPARLNLVSAWREAKVFSDAEHAALELTEQRTRIADAAGGATDEAWATRRRASRRGSARRPDVAHRHHRRLQPRERHRPTTRRRLPAGPVRRTRGTWQVKVEIA
jgi:AhpD family alkylhydroperoxidase